MLLINHTLHATLGSRTKQHTSRQIILQEYMAAVLSNNMNDIKQVTLFMEESRHRGIPVCGGPDVNESLFKFRVNPAGAIRFGLGAMRGVGEGAVAAVIEGRGDGDGVYKSLFDFARRVSPKDVNKRCL